MKKQIKASGEQINMENMSISYYAYCNVCREALSKRFGTSDEAWPFAAAHHTETGHETTVKLRTSA
jgi:hypothetical protein